MGALEGDGVAFAHCLGGGGGGGDGRRLETGSRSPLGGAPLDCLPAQIAGVALQHRAQLGLDGGRL